MAKKKNKVARYYVSLNEPQDRILWEMMKEDAQTDISSFIGFIIVSEWKARQLEKAKKPVGRPRKEDDNEEEWDQEEEYKNDLPKNINYYGSMIGPREYADKMELQKQFKSHG